MTAMINQEIFKMDRFTAKPKWWGKLRHKSKLKASEFFVLDVIYEKTFGWNKSTDKISISQFQEELGLSNRSVIDSLEELKNKGLIFVVGSQRKINIITLNIEKCEQLAGEVFSKTGEKSSQDKNNNLVKKFPKLVKFFPATGEVFSKTGEKSSHTLEHYTRTLPYTNTLEIRARVFELKNSKNQKPKKQTSKLDLQIQEIFNTWLKLTNQKIELNPKRKSHIGQRLKTHTPEQIIQAMQFVANSTWHQQNGQVRIELVIRSDEQLDQQLIKANAAKSVSSSLAVNQQNWGKVSEPVTANVSSLDDFFC